MRRHSALCICCAFASVAGCGTADGTAPPEAERRALRSSVPTVLRPQTSVLEESLKARIVSNYTGRDAIEMARILNTPGPVELKTSNVKLRPLFDSISALRRARVAARDAASGSLRDSLRAALVLVERLDEAGAVALIIRNAADGEDMIVLEAGRATPHELGLAVSALAELRRNGGGGRYARSIVRDLPRTAPRDSLQFRAMQTELALLRASARTDVPAVGPARRISIFVAR